MAIIKRKYFNNEHYVLDMKNKELTLSPDFHKILLEKKLYGGRGFKKVGGSSLGDWLLTDSYRSQFAAFCNIANLGLPILNEKYVKAGVAIESKVIEVIEKTSKCEVTTYPAQKYNYDYFADKDEILGGLPDGYIKEKNLVIEIKTTGEKNLAKWTKDGVPLNYKKQAAQYAYLMGANRYSIVATFLKEEDYLSPETFPIEKRKIKNWSFDVDRNEVEDDIRKIKTLYVEWVQSGASPAFNPIIDADLLRWLECSNASEWETLKEEWRASGKYVE